MATLTDKDIAKKLDQWASHVRWAAPAILAASQIEKEIKAWLKKSGRKKIRIEGNGAVAIKDEKFGSREIGLGAFLSEAAEKPEDERDSCLKVEVAKAEKLLGKDAIDRISTRPTVADIRVELKEPEEHVERPANQVVDEYGPRFDEDGKPVTK